MTPEIKALVERVERLDAEATKGPWETTTTEQMTVEEMVEHERKWIEYGGPGVIRGVWAPDHPLTVIGPDRHRPEHAVMPAVTGNGPASEANADLIAEYRTACPALAAALRSSEGAREELAGKVGDFLDRLIDHFGGVPTESFIPETVEEALWAEAMSLRAHLAPKPAQAKEEAT